MNNDAIGIALAGGGPLGAIYEIGALVALDEALAGIDLTDCDIYVGVSSGAFLATGLANGLTPRAMYEKFIETEAADDPFEPDVILRLAFGEYGRRLLTVPKLFFSAAFSYLKAPRTRGFFESFQRLTRAIPTGVFDNARIGEYMRSLSDAPGRTNDFRRLERKLFIVATDLDAGIAVPFGSAGWDHVPISLAVQASSALPGLFPPVKIGGRHYVDGALVKTLHASVALKEGAKLLICLNPLVPFDAELARQQTGQTIALVDGGLPTVLAQTFRSIIHSRMKVAMSHYASEFPDADVVLFEPSQGDTELFFANVFSYAERERLSEHAYQRTRADLLHRYEELAPIFRRHGILIRRSVLTDMRRTLSGTGGKSAGGTLMASVEQLHHTLHRVEHVLRSDEPDVVTSGVDDGVEAARGGNEIRTGGEMTMAGAYAQWKPFTREAGDFDYGGAKLKRHWPQLHRGDCEPYPDEAALQRLIDAHPGLAPAVALNVAAKRLQDAWRAFHAGDFGAAVEKGLALGRLGYGVANKAAIIYATYLEHDKDRKIAALLDAAHRGEEIESCAPTVPNGWYFRAQALGRYGQYVSVTKALAEGLGGKIKAGLEKTLELEPHHADANIALGLYHALVINKMGGMIGRLTYGASTQAGLDHFEAALKLGPDSAIARIEYANGLVMMFGKSKMEQAIHLYEEAAAHEPLDAMERLDVELAKAEFRE